MSNCYVSQQVSFVWCKTNINIDIVYLVKSLVKDKLEVLGIETVGSLLLTVPRASEHIHWYCTLFGNTLGDGKLEFLLKAGLDSKFAEYKIKMAQYFYGKGTFLYNYD